MNKEEREAMIREKQAEIDRLQSEIQDLRCGFIKSIITNEFIRTVGIKDGEVIIKKSKNGWGNEWDDVKALACKLFFVKGDARMSWYGDEFYHSVRMKQKDMTDEQRKLSAQFCDEIIDIYNKYVMKGNSFMLNGKPYSLKEGKKE